MEIVKNLLLEFKKNHSKSGYGFQKECEDLASLVLWNMIKSNLPPLKIDVKDDEESIKYREEGNYFFVNGNDLKAIELYSKSLAYAKSEEMMSYARANRSAALYRKKIYIECIIDINAALTLNYPAEKAEKLQERGQKALNQIKKVLNLSKSKDHRELLELFEQYEKRNEDKKESPLKFNFKENGLEDEFKKINIDDDEKKREKIDISVVSGIAPDPRYMTEEGKITITYGPNKEAPSISKGLKICQSEKYGRHIIATKPFRPGDVLAIEHSFSHILYMDKYYTHCHHCLIRNYNLIPCPNCPISMYCSEKCRSLAWKHAHKTECPILSMLASLLNVDTNKIDQLMKILRFFIELTDNGQSINELKKDLESCELNPDKRTAGFTEKGSLDSQSARSALSLTTNLTFRPLGDISALACIASLSAILLATQTTFFGKKYDQDHIKEIVQREDIRFCCSIMLRAAMILTSNSFSIQIEPGTKSGSGLFVVQSLFNHACAPNTVRHFEGLTMITRALVPIAPGEQVFTSYCGGYQYSSKRNRQQKILEDYYFECDCTACIEDWPTYTDIVNNHIGTIEKNKELSQKIAPFRTRIKENKYDIEAIKCILEVLWRETKMPCEEMTSAIQYLKSYYLGKFYKMEQSEPKSNNFCD